MVFNKRQPEGEPDLKSGIPVDPETYRDFKNAAKDMIAKFEETYKKKLSPGSTHLAEIAGGKFYDIVGKWKIKIYECFQKRMEGFAKIVENAKAERTALKEQISGKPGPHHEALSPELEDLKEEAMKAAADEAQPIIDDFAAIVAQNVEGPEITTADVREIDHAVHGLQEVLNQPGLKVTIEKLQKGQPLEKEDYEAVIRFLNPRDINKSGMSPKESFDSSAAGYVIGLMNEEQRAELLRVFIGSNKADTASELIDAFLRTGLIGRESGKELFGMALTGKKLGQQEHAQFMSRLEGGFYGEEIAKNRQALENEIRGYEGRYSKNIMNRVVGMPLIGGVMALWGLIWFGLNAAVNKGKFWKSPYSFVALGALGAGAEVATSSIKEGSPLLGGGVIGGMFHGNDTNAKRAEWFDDKTRAKLFETYDTAPDELRNYFKNGGFATIRELRIKLEAERKRPNITIDGLLSLEKDPRRIGHLKKLKESKVVDESSINQKFDTIAEAAHILKIKDNDAFSAEIAATQEDAQVAKQATKSTPDAPSENPTSATT